MVFQKIFVYFHQNSLFFILSKEMEIFLESYFIIILLNSVEFYHFLSSIPIIPNLKRKGCFYLFKVGIILIVNPYPYIMIFCPFTNFTKIGFAKRSSSSHYIFYLFYARIELISIVHGSNYKNVLE